MKAQSDYTPRERLRNVIRFKKTDMLPWVEVFYDETLIKFFSEGLPVQSVVDIEWTLNYGGSLLLNWPVLRGFDPYPYFGCTNIWGCVVPVDVGPLPRFKLRRISENGKYLEYVTEVGQKARRFKRGASEAGWYMMPMFTEFPVKDMKTWEVYKTRLNPDDPRRYPKDWEKDGYIQMFEEYQAGPTMLPMNGFYGFGAQLMGIQNFVLAFYNDPELIREMVSYWEDYTIRALAQAVETLNERIDLVFWFEDLAERHGPNISPKLYKEFLLPHYKGVIGFLNRNGIDRVMMDTDGNANQILDLALEAGITGTLPLEVNAGMDTATLRRRYPDNLFLIGNLDKEKIARGGDCMRSEIDSKLPLMKELGGCIPGLDHDVPTSFTFQKFAEYAEYLKSKLMME